MNFIWYDQENYHWTIGNWTISCGVISRITTITRVPKIFTGTSRWSAACPNEVINWKTFFTKNVKIKIECL